MTANGILQIVLYLAVLIALAPLLGGYMATVFEGKRCFMSPVLAPLEAGLYRLAGVDPRREQDWKQYATALLLFNLLGLVVVYLVLRLQAVLPLNPQALSAVGPELAFNTAVSFVTNTNWQSYGGETTMSYLSQMFALGAQNFLSAASGIAVLLALIRGFASHPAVSPGHSGAGPAAADLGNFWVDLTRSVLYVLLPLSVLLALVLVSQGVVQSLAPNATVSLVEPLSISVPQTDAAGETVKDASGEDVMVKQVIDVQTIPLGPAASQIAIKQLGTNGGGFFNVNSAHPFENPTPLANFLELLSILLIPAALCFTFGKMVGDPRQGGAVLIAMLVIFAPLNFAGYAAEQSGNPLLTAVGTDQVPSELQSGGNMEGKEARFGIANSTLWAAATTAASNGSVNAMHGSFTPLGGLVPTFLMQLGEVVFGGVGSGLYGLLMFAIVAVFIAGLMVGRTPEYLGKKIEAYEVKMASLVLLIPCVVVLFGTAIASVVPAAAGAVGNPGPHAFSEILYAFSSAGNNNGSAFGGLSANNPFYNFGLGIAMWLSRIWLMIPVLAIAGSLVAKRHLAHTAGTLPTHGSLFIAMLVGTVLLVGALNFVPALALGPVVEHLQMIAVR